jgi:hypothetical protein
VAHFSRYLAPDGTWLARPDEPAEPLTVTIPTSAPDGVCGPLKLAEKRPTDTVIGELRTEVDTTDATFTFGKHSDSDISVGVRTSGGNWSATGDHHIGNALENAIVGHADHNEHMVVETRFEYGLFRCSYGPYETTKSLGWVGDSIVPYPTPHRGCDNAKPDFLAHKGAKTEFTRGTERAAHWGAAAELFGFSFGTRSGYSTRVTSHWVFGPEPDHLLCGDDAGPGRSSHVFAGFVGPAPEACRPGRPC